MPSDVALLDLSRIFLLSEEKETCWAGGVIIKTSVPTIVAINTSAQQYVIRYSKQGWALFLIKTKQNMIRKHLLLSTITRNANSASMLMAQSAYLEIA